MTTEIPAFVEGFLAILEPINLLFCLGGVLLGMMVGVLPGLGPVATISILLPLTYAMEPLTAVIMLAGIYYGAQYGGTITSVLLKLPGEATSVVTAIDGYAMARRGRAGAALGISALGSFIGGTAAIVGISMLAPALAGVALSFGPPEYAALAILGIILVSTLGEGSVWKGLVAAAAGLFVATIGMDPMSGVPRFTFDVVSLNGGIDFVPIAMGLFGISEIMLGVERRASGHHKPVPFSRATLSMADWVASRLAIARGTVLGFLIGLLPGGGATLSTLLSYSVEKRVAKDPSEFGKGAIAGVAGPETSNNAAATSSFVPLLTLGIPANAVMAVLFGALLVQGITPGPSLIDEHPVVFWGVINSMWIGNLFLLILSFPLIGIFVRLTQINGAILGPLTLGVTLLGVYTVSYDVNDIWITVIFGMLGYLMRKSGFDPAPFVLAFILGGILESSMRQSLALFQGSIAGFAGRPLALVIIGSIACAVVVLQVRASLSKRRDRAQISPTVGHSGSGDAGVK